MGNTANYYGVLFGIQFAIFGILLASIFVIVQLVYSTFSREPVQFILRSWTFRCYLALTAFSLFSTAVSFLLLSLPLTDSIKPAVDLVQTAEFLVGSLVVFLLSFLVFIRLLFECINLLKPQNIIAYFSAGFDVSEMRRFLRKKYGIHEPTEPVRFRIVVAGEGKEINNESPIENPDRATELQRNLRHAATLKEGAKDAIDQFVFITDVGIAAIKRADFGTLSQICDLVTKLSQRSWTQVVDSASDTHWSPDRDQASNYVKHIIEFSEILREVSQKEGLVSAELRCVEITEKLFELICSESDSKHRCLIYQYWKRLADGAVGRSPEIFKKAIRMLRKGGDRELDTYDKGALDTVFRILGWLGERLLSKSELRERALMLESESTTEYEELFEALSGFSFRYNNERPDQYPLIYFDAIMVVFRQLVLKYENGRTQYLAEQIQSFVYDIESFGQKAVEVGNISGAELAALRLLELLDRLKEGSGSELSKDVVDSLLDLALLSSGRPEHDLSDSILQRTLHEWILDELVKRNEQSCIVTKMSGKFPKFYGTKYDFAKYYLFLKTIGKRVGSNFGYNFDYMTGEDFSAEDPRRR